VPGQAGLEADARAAFARCEARRGNKLSKKLYVGNLSFSTTEDELRAVFERHGGVESVKVIMDRDTGRPRGFAFVEMQDAQGAAAAMRALNGTEVGGRSLRVDEAQERQRTERRGGRY
jgi:RNA recognition motif-containing protein